jgi:integrase
MKSSPLRDPAYRHYKPKDLAVVRLGGKDFYLGRYNSLESWERYHRLLAERHKGSIGAPTSPQAAPIPPSTITQLCIGYYHHAQTYYVMNGRPTRQVSLIRYSLKVLRQLFGSTLAKDFGPIALRTCQAEFARIGLCRNEINRRVSLIKAMFKWGVSQELVPASCWQALLAVSGLRKGRTEARESEPVGPVPEAIVERTLEHLCPTVIAMVRLQLVTAMRPGELVTMKAGDLDMSGPIWEYRPGSHKTQHHDKTRLIMIGPRGQEIIKQFLSLDIGSYLFNPQRAHAEQMANRRARRRTKLWPSHEQYHEKQRAARGRKPLGDHYSVNAYRIAISHACDVAFPHPELPERFEGEPAREFVRRRAAWRREHKAEISTWRKAHRWHPNQLRHSAATLIRKHYGAESSQAVLGHAQLQTTEIYAERDLNVARQIMQEIG